jgi:hypothetical protein
MKQMMVRTPQEPTLIAYVVAEGNGCRTLAYIGQTALGCCGSSTSQKNSPQGHASAQEQWPAVTAAGYIMAHRHDQLQKENQSEETVDSDQGRHVIILPASVALLLLLLLLLSCMLSINLLSSLGWASQHDGLDVWAALAVTGTCLPCHRSCQLSDVGQLQGSSSKGNTSFAAGWYSTRLTLSSKPLLRRVRSKASGHMSMDQP